MESFKLKLPSKLKLVVLNIDVIGWGPTPKQSFTEEQSELPIKDNKIT